MKKIIILGIGLQIAAFLNAQLDNKEIIVDQTYIPTVKDADKIEVKASIKDSIEVKPEFSYRIYPKSLDTEVEIQPIKPAKLSGIRVDDLKQGYAILGLGNRQLPYMSVGYSSSRDKSLHYGANYTLDAIRGKIEALNGQEIPASQVHSDLNLFGSKFFKKVSIHGKLGLNSISSRYYGVQPDTTLADFESDDLKQQAHRFYSEVSVQDLRKNKKYAYAYHLGYDHAWDRYEFNEDILKIKGENLYRLNQSTLRLDGDFSAHSNNLLDTSLQSYQVLNLRPTFETEIAGNVTVHLGLNLAAVSDENETEISVAPIGLISFNLADELLSAFFGISGSVQDHGYFDLIRENPFVRPGSIARPSNTKFSAYGGFKGLITDNLSYLIQGGIRNIQDARLFVQDSNGGLFNQFTPVLDDLDVLSIKGTIQWHEEGNTLLKLNAGYNEYVTSEDQAFAWHLPSIWADFHAKQKIDEKIAVYGNIKYRGMRNAFDLYANENIELSQFATMHIGGTYSYSELITLFAELENMTATKYSWWNQYPNFRFQFMFGVKMVF